MGNKPSDLSKYIYTVEQIQEHVNDDNVSLEEIQALLKIFSLDGINHSMQPISAKQFVTLIVPMLHNRYPNSENFHPHNAVILYHYFDTDHTGFLDNKEFVSGVVLFKDVVSEEDAVDKHKHKMEQKAKHVFSALDKNGDGSVDRKELMEKASMIWAACKKGARVTMKEHVKDQDMEALSGLVTFATGIVLSAMEKAVVKALTNTIVKADRKTPNKAIHEEDWIRLSSTAAVPNKELAQDDVRMMCDPCKFVSFVVTRLEDGLAESK